MSPTTPLAGTDLEIIDLARADHPEAVGVLARGMRDNPLHIAAFGTDADRRERRLMRMFTGLFATFGRLQPFGLRRDGALVAVACVSAPGACLPTVGERLRMTPGLAKLGPPAAIRTLRWLGAWEKRDPDEAHSHVGPLAVDRHLQGQGIGSALLAEYCRRLDAATQVGYLETDKPDNVRFYQRAGYTVTGEQDVLGVPNWFMRREPRRG